MSLQDQKPDIDKLVVDILIDSAAKAWPANSYLDRRLALIDDCVGGVGLSTVDRYVAEELVKVIDANPDMDETTRQNIQEWCDANLMARVH